MRVIDRPLYDQIMKAKLTMVAYHQFPVGTASIPYIAQDHANVDNFTVRPSIENSDFVNKVDMLLSEAGNRCFTEFRFNREAVRCEVEGISYPIYFVAFGQQRIITRAIDPDRSSKEILIFDHVKHTAIMSDIKIERNIAKPPLTLKMRQKGPSGKFAIFYEMKDGDSVFFPEEKLDKVRSGVSTHKTTAKWPKEKRDTWEFSFAEVEEGTPKVKGVRVWLDVKKKTDLTGE